MRLRLLLAFVAAVLFSQDVFAGVDGSEPISQGLVDVTTGRVVFPLPAKLLDLDQLGIATTLRADEQDLWVGGAAGESWHYCPLDDNHWCVDSSQVKAHFANSYFGNIGAALHPKNHRIVKDEQSDTYLLLKADGRQRRYEKRETCEYRLIWEDNANGTQSHYDYDRDGRITSIRHATTEGEILSQVSWEHQEARYVYTASDGLKFTCELTTKGLLSKIICPDKSVYSYRYDIWGRLEHYEQPDGYYVSLRYNLDGRVSELRAPLGHDDQAQTLTCYRYGQGYTDVEDAAGVTTRYRHDGCHVLAQEESFRTRQYWWDDAGQLIGCALIDESDRAVWSRVFTYDSLGNLDSETLYGNLTGSGPSAFKVREGGLPWDSSVEGYRSKYFYDDRQRLIEKQEDNGTFTLFSYLADTELVTLQRMGDSSGIKLRTLFTYDKAMRKLDTIIDDGQSSDPADITGITHRRSMNVIYADGKPLLVDEKYFDPQASADVIQKTMLHMYDVDGRLKERHFLDGEGFCQQSSTFGYDAMGRTTSMSGQAEDIKQYRYDPMGRVTQARDSAKGVTVSKGYNPLGCCVSTDIVDTKKHAFHQSQRYDALGRCVDSWDIYGNKTSYTYDDWGRLTHTYYPAIANGEVPVIERRYDVCDHVVQVIDPLGDVTKIYYTARGTPARVEYPDGATETFAYNLDGTLRSSRARSGVETLYERDYLSRVIEKTLVTDQGENITTKATYTPFFLSATTDALGCTTSLTHDASGKVTTALLEWADGSAVKEYAYDNHDNLASVKHWFGFGNDDCTDVRYQRDEKGKATGCQIVDHYEQTLVSSSYLDPLSDARKGAQVDEDYNYLNALGQKVLQRKITDDFGVTTIMTYDALGHVVEVEQRDSFGVTLTLSRFEYDVAGHRIKEAHGVDASLVTEYQYGLGGRLDSCTERAGTSQAATTTYFYKPTGQLATILKPDGVRLTVSCDSMGRLLNLSSSDGTVDNTYFYDATGRPSEVSDAIAKHTITRTYHPLGGLEREEMSSGLVVSKTFDRQGRPSQLILPDGSGIQYEYDAARLVALHRVDACNDKIYSHKYTQFSPEGRPKEAQLIGAAGTCAWTFDDKGRCDRIDSHWWSQVIRERDVRGNVLRTRIWDTQGKHDQQYSYDGLGQLITESGRQYHYDSLGNRLGNNDVIERDLNGNVIAHGAQKLRYDALNRLIEVEKPTESKVIFTYDAFDRRLSKTVFHWINGKWDSGITQRYLYDGEREIGAVDGDGEIVELRVLGVGIQGDVGAAVAIELKNKAFAPIHDHRGSIVCLVAADQSGVIESYRYGAFGQELSPAQPLSPWRFSSKRVDDETGLVFFGKRYYDPMVGQWLTPDPLGTADGPNRYAFVHNNPMNLIDPQGLFSVDTLWDSLTMWSQDYLDRLASFSLADLFRGSFISGILDDLSFVAQELIGPGLFLLAGLHNEDIEFGVYGNGEFSDKIRVSHVNGVLNIREGAVEAAELISSSHGGINVHYLYRPTEGWAGDIIRGLFTLIGYTGPTARRLAEGWRELIDEVGGVGNGGMIMHYAHSLGGVETARARRLMTPEEQKMIRVTTFGSPKVLSDEGFLKVRNYISWYDNVVMSMDPWAYFDAATSSNSNVTFLIPLGYMVVDHHFSGPTYRKMLEELGRRFVALYDPSHADTVYITDRLR